MQISRVALVWTQKTGAPISRSRRVPPPTPVTTAKKMKVTSVWLLLRGEQRAGDREHRDPEIIEQLERGGDGVGSVHATVIARSGATKQSSVERWIASLRSQ